MLYLADVVCTQRVAAEQALKAFQEHPEAWTRVDSILEKAKAQQTKYFALQVSTALQHGCSWAQAAPPTHLPKAARLCQTLSVLFAASIAMKHSIKCAAA